MSHRCAHRVCWILISAPEYNWDDYKDAEFRRKVALLFLNEPRSDDAKFFKGKALTYYGGGAAYKFEETARRGAIRTLIILPHGPGRLQLGRAAEFLGKRAILPAPGHQPEIAVSSVDTVRGGEKTCCHGRIGSGQAV